MGNVEVIADPGATWRIPGEPYERSWRRMEELIEATANAGAQVFKPQLYTADIYPAGSDEHALLKPYEMPREWVPRLAQSCALVGLELMVTVYVPEDVAFIDPYVKRFKVASFENEHEALIEAVTVTKKPMIVSTGGWNDDLMMDFWEQWGGERVTLLHCVSAYPARSASMNMRQLLTWNVADGAYRGADILWSSNRMGLSDHTTDVMAATMAVVCNAPIIEKHICANSTPLGNPDAPHSASPYGFACYVNAIREAELMLGDGVKRVMDGEEVQWRYDPATGKRGVKA